MLKPETEKTKISKPESRLEIIEAQIELLRSRVEFLEARAARWQPEELLSPVASP